MPDTVLERIYMRLISFWQGHELEDIEERNRIRVLAQRVIELLPASAQQVQQNPEDYSTLIRDAIKQLSQHPHERALFNEFKRDTTRAATSVIVTGNNNITVAGSMSTAGDFIVGKSQSTTPPTRANESAKLVAQHKPLDSVNLSLRFLSQGVSTQVIWEADVLGQRTSHFQAPYDQETLPLVIRALNAAQSLIDPGFDATEQEQLEHLGLWMSTRLAAHIEQHMGRAIYTALTADPAGARALDTIRNHAIALGLPINYLLRFPPNAVDLATLPWELLHDEHGSIFMSRGTPATIVRYLDLEQALPPPMQPSQALRVLSITPNAHIPADIHDEERIAHHAAWADLLKAGAVTLEELKPATPINLVDRIQAGPPIDIVHFYGHGRYKDGQGALLFDMPDGEMMWVNADRVAAILSNVRLVALFACRSAYASDGGLLSGVASKLSAAGVPAVIAMQLVVRASAAARIAAVIYRALARGESVQHAVSLARQALFVEEADGVSWYIPTLTIRARQITPLYVINK